MANLNKVMLIGNLTRDPELRTTPKGTSICSFSLAVNRKWRDETGADKEEVTFIDLEAWGKTADVIAKYMTKGKPMFVEGRLKLEQWEDKETKQKRSRMKVVCENFQFLNSGQQQAAPASAPRAAPAAAENLDEDVPF